MAREDNRLKIMLTEYDCAQRSAEAHDHIFWLIISIFIGSSFIALAMIISNLCCITNDYLILAFASIMIVIGILIINILESQRLLKKMKYNRCKELEKKIAEEFKDLEIEIKNHSMTKILSGEGYWLILKAIIILLILGWLSIISLI